MLRAWFILIVVAGLFSSMLSNCGRTVASLPSGFQHVSESDGESRTLITSGSSDTDLSADNGVVLDRQWDGHFYADTQINGATVRMLVDTGASGIALTRDDARRAGIGISIGMPNVVGRGAGGDVRGEYVTLDRVSLGGESAQSMQAVVLDGGGQSLLGQSFLSRFASVEIKGDKMVLR